MRPSLPRLVALVGFLAAASGPRAADAPPAFIGQLSLVRFDMPLGLSGGLAPTRQLARREADAPEGVDWPDFTLNGQPIFRDRAEEQVPLKLRAGAEAASPFQMPGDDVLQPGNRWHWRSARSSRRCRCAAGPRAIPSRAASGCRAGGHRRRAFGKATRLPRPRAA